MSDSYSVKAVLSAQDKNFSSVFKKAGGFADSFADKLTSGLGFGILTGIGQKAFNVISGAASGAISSIVDTGKSFESATSQIAATMGKPKKEIQNLIDKAAELGKTTKFTATEAAEGLNILAMSGLSAEQQLAAIDDVLNLAAAGAENMDAAAQQVVGTMKGFSMEIDGATNGVKNARYVSDLLAKGASLAATDVNMLGTALSDASATSASYGQSADRTAVALLRLAEQNVTGAEAATALNRAMMDLYTPTSTAAKTLKRLGVSAYDSSGKAKDFNVVVDELSASLSGMSEEEQNAAKNAIFSTYGLQAFNKMVVSSSDKVKEFEDGLASASDGIGAAAEMAAEQMNNLEGDMTLMSSSMDGLRNSIYEKFNAPMRAATKLATSGIEAITQKIEKMGDSLSKLIDLDALKKAIDEGGFSAGLSELLKGLDKIPEGFRAAGAAAAAGLGAMVLGGPLQNLPGIFNGATTAANVFGHKLRALPKNAVKGFQNLKTAAGNVATRIGNAGAKISNMLPAKLGPKIGAVTGKFSGLGNVIKSKVVPADSLMSKIWQKMPNVMAPVGRAAEGAGKTLKKVSGVGLKAMTGMVNGITSVIGIGLQAIAPAVLIGAALAGLGVLYNKFGSQIDSFVETAVTKGPEVISGFVSGITSRLPELMNAGSQMLTGFLRVITANIPAIASGAMLLISTLAQGVMDNIPQLLPAVVSLVGTFASTVIDMAPKLIILGLQLVLSLVNGIVGNIGQIVETAVSLIGQFSNTFASNLPTIVSLGIEILMKLAAGIIQALPAIIVAGIQGISVLINSISSQLPRILQAGVTIIGMLISGIVNNLPAIMQAAVGAIQALISGIVQNLPAIISAGFTIIGQLVVGIVQMLPSIVTSGWEIIKSLASGIIEAIPNVLTGVIDGIKGVFSNLWDFITGKSSASTAEITASVTEMSGSWQSSTADMAAASTMNFDALGTNVGAAMQTANATVSAEAETMKANVSGYISTMESLGSADVGDLASSIISSTGEASSAGSGNMEALAGSFDTSFSGAEQAVTSSMQTATATVESSAAQMNAAASQGAAQAEATVKQAGNQITSALRSTSSTAIAITRSMVSGITAAMRSGYSGAYSAGSYIGSGLASGMRSQLSNVRSVAAQLASAADAAIRAKAKISSPSKVTRADGRFWGEGLALGIMDEYRTVKNAAQKLVMAPDMAMPEINRSAFVQELDESFSYNGSRVIRIETPVTIDGREVARATAEYDEKEQGRRRIHEERKAGHRAAS